MQSRCTIPSWIDWLVHSPAAPSTAWWLQFSIPIYYTYIYICVYAYMDYIYIHILYIFTICIIISIYRFTMLISWFAAWQSEESMSIMQILACSKAHRSCSSSFDLCLCRASYVAWCLDTEVMTCWQGPQGHLCTRALGIAGATSEDLNLFLGRSMYPPNHIRIGLCTSKSRYAESQVGYLQS